MSDSENHAESDVRRSSRRCGVSQKKSKELSAIEQLKLARSTGKAYRPELDVEDVYDTVDDDEYEKIVAKRQKDNFIVDDDGMGYVDNGVDFEDDYEDDYAPSSSKNSNSSKKGEKKPKKDKKKGGLHAFLSTTSTKKPIDESVVKAEFDDDEEVKNMLEQLGSSDEEAEEKPKATPANPFKRGRKFDSPSGSDSLAPRPIAKKAKREATGLAEHKFQRHVKVDEDEDYGIPDDYPVASPVTSPVKTEKMAEVEAPTAPAIQKIEETVKMETEHLEEVEDSLAKFRVIEDWTGGSSSQEDEDVKVEVKTGSEAFYTMGGEDNTTKAIRMYWIDAYEDVHKANGTVYLFGKVKTSGNAWETCSIVVKNICRKVYFMPRTKNLSTGEESSLAELHKEIGDVLRNKFNTHEFKCKMVEKELIRDESFGYGCGTKSPLMEVLYPAEKGKLPSDLKGDTFSNTFNTSVTPLERLLIEKKFMGPGWIELYNYSDPKAKTSNCKYEFEVDMEKMRNIKYLESSDAPPPTIKLLALNVVTTLNDRKDNEICMISMLFNPKCDLAHPSGDSKDLKPKCLVTKPPGGSLPYDIQKRLETEKLSKFVKSVANEKALLTLFLAMINEDEPDMIVGHDLSATIALLVSRLEKLKLPNWSRISRLKRSINIGKIGHSKSGQWELTAGRMMLDSKLAAMELVKSRSFDLTELSQQILGAERREIYANEIPQLYVDSKDLISLINWSWNDLLLSLRIVVRLNALPLYIQISQIVGGIASRTMMGGRAERNEYLLLHAFEKADLIAPDKYNSSESKKKKEESQEGDEKKSGKAQYSGGLVLEPKKGLYETLILLLDFNSLYPSIIQEYNICYTTLEYSKDSDEQLSVPQSTDIEGVLPREIRKLVECRRDVKSLMKSERNEAKKKQMDIRQMALKLTANSMYGCLGFQYSRFYAKPLAALVTAKGREILMHSKDLVEKMGYSVVYGDTDSIMINTNSVDLVAAKKLGNEIKKAVNKCHRLLELDLDGVFKRMLLLKKKKYAALTINPDTKVEAKELKGLDIVRRDWSQLAKETGTAVVDKILDASLTRDEMVSSIDDLLREIRAKLDSGTVPLEMFQISKQLTRNPEQYADVKAQCHAAVAQRLNKSGKFNLRHNDIVEYVICEDGTDNPATQRAYHRTEMAENSALKIDLLYYLAQQIHPVVSRLVEPIEETDAVRIAENLGLDSTNYRRAAAAQASQRAAEEDCAWHQENYDLCEGIHVICPLDGCGHSNVIRETFDCVTDASSPRLLFSGCAQCQGSWDLQEHQAVIGNQVDRQMSEFVARHHLAAFKCDEPTCEFKTRVQTMKWCREGLECIRCSTGVLRREYTSKQLFDQQMFFRTILDVDAAVRKLSDAQKKAAKVRVEYNGCKIDSMMLADRINEKYLEKNAYNRMDETRFEDDDFEGSTANKKYTFFIIDGNPAMFETSKAGEPPEFKLALKLILDEIVRVCCSRSLNNHIGVIVTSTKNSETEGLENSTLLVPMGVLGQEEVNKIKEIAEEENLLSAVNNYGGDHHKSDLSNVLNYCKRVFASCSNTRHQSVIYLTNNRNPFERDDFLESSHFKRTKAAVTKIIGEGHRKTLGEFSVIMLPEDGYKPQDKDEKRKEPWYDLDTEVFSTECDAAARIRQKITAQRSHATLTVNVGPGVTFDVSVFSMVMEAKPLDHSQKYTRDTEEKIVKTSGYVKKESKMELESTEIETQDSVLDETQKMLIRCKFLEDSIRNRRDLKKSIEIGGEKIILDGDQYEYMNEVNSKGVDFVGFCSMSRVDRETSVVSSKIIQPNDQTTLGSTAIYRTFLDRCWARQQAIVCKYQSRSKQKMRLMALVPFKKDMTLIEKRHENGEDDDDMEDKKPDLLRLEQQRAQADSSEWLHEGFMLVGQPFREELRDDFKRFEEQQNVLTEPSTEEQVNTMKQFVKRLTMSYNPSFYENPRLLSERSALCLEATGEELIERRDTLEPYYQIPKRLQRVGTEIEKIVETFALNDEIKETKPKASAGRKRKTDDDEPSTSKKATMTIRDCIAADKIGKFKKDELLSMAVEHCEASKSLKSKTKNDIIAVIEAYLDENPSATWNI